MLVFGFLSCNRKKEKTLFELMDHTGVDFQNKVEDGKVENSFLFRNFYNGGGVAAGDLNNDGLPDLFFTSNTGENKLYLNKGDFKFEDISVKAGIVPDDKWYTGVVFVDINNDGWLDIYVSSSGHMSTGNRRNKLYINNHDLTFTESAAKYGLDISAYTTQVSFFDYDGDGDLDCFMINNSPIPVNQVDFVHNRNMPEKQWPVGEFLKGGGDHLFRNDHGHFTEVTAQAGIHGSLISFGLGVAVGDINGDGWPDVYVSNDSYERDYLYINQHDGTFKDEFEQWIMHTSMSSMGADLVDINNDGFPEIFTTDMLPDDDYRLKTTGAFDNIDLYRTKQKAGLYRQFVKNCLQLNNRNGKYLEIGNYAGVSASDWSWGALMFDADNDGFNDIYICNGVNRDVIDLDFMDFFANDVIQKMVLTGNKQNVDEVLRNIPRNPLPNKIFRNKGNLQFEDMGKSWGIIQPSFSNGAAYVDLDGDGDLDLVVNNENQEAFIYRNNARELNHNNYLAVSLQGDSLNRFAIGSKIKLFSGQEIFSRELIPSRGFQSSMDYKLIVGLGKKDRLDSAQIIWPDRTMTVIPGPAINQVLKVAKPAGPGMAAPVAPAPATQPLLATVTTPFLKHQEDDYTDFYYERNLPEMLSREGPKAAKGDLNGDGLEDLYIGGTQGHPGQVYLQTPSGQFILQPEKEFEQFSDFEDGALVFFDADHDGDLDLFIGPGGNNNPPYSRQMQQRLFLNDGHGIFHLALNAFGNTTTGANAGAALAYDFNNDGYMDLFVGGRSVPREYGADPVSNIYLNDGHGHFTDIARTRNPEIANIGMVTGAVMADLEGNGRKELVIVGEWMAPRIFSYQGDRFVEINSGLGNLYGWWQTVAAGDIDGDGREDLVLGNIGENFYLHPDSAHPVKLWINDFDLNGFNDIILSRTVNGKDMPVFLKHDMEDQVPSLKKQNLRHHEFALKSIQELFPGDLVKKASLKKFNFCPSVICYNTGKGGFRVEPLPAMAQLSSANAIVLADIDGDGRRDLVVGGNNFCFLPQFGRLDASLGTVLLNHGKGNFEWLYPDRSGLRIEGMVRDLLPVRTPKGDCLLFLVNDEQPRLYEIKKKAAAQTPL
jgi:enediyne biosynthesis protein E4